VTVTEDSSARPDAPLDAPVERALAFLAATRTADVRGEDLWPEAGRKVLRLHFARAIVRVPGVIAGEDPEEVHAMRVASRRMRAAWRVFGGGFERSATRRYRADLREVGGRLGTVRDLDVLLGILDGYGRRHGARATRGLLPLRAAWVAEREARRGVLVEHLSSPAFVAFVTEHEAFLGAPAAELGAVERPSPGRVRGRMPATAWTAYQEVWTFDDRVAGADLATLHQLRIAGKWLRYTLEFVREALASDAAALIEPVVALQDHLGDQHDLHVAATLAREFAAGDRPLTTKELAQVEGFVRRLDVRVAWHGERLPRVWSPLVSPAYRARLGRALARL
jgi:triphosphatase